MCWLKSTKYYSNHSVALLLQAYLFSLPLNSLIMRAFQFIPLNHLWTRVKQGNQLLTGTSGCVLGKSVFLINLKQFYGGAL
jgi:hypothetical protein